MKVSWVYDLISPYSYLSLYQLSGLPVGVQVEPVPVLFAGLLNHYGQMGPAEIDPKRRFTYRFVVWRARRMGVPLKMPPAHPFNPLNALRLVIAAGNDLRAIRTAFEFIWVQGRDVSDQAAVADLARELDIADPRAALSDANIKQTLRSNTEWAATRGVFGVPTFVVDDEIFWGHDAFEMALDYMRDPVAFNDAEMSRIDHLPVGVTRPRVTPTEKG
jgi:2-hydroxychromene-2-carboxylate isomerase